MTTKGPHTVVEKRGGGNCREPRREGTSRVLRERSVGSVGRLGRGSLELCMSGGKRGPAQEFFWVKLRAEQLCGFCTSSSPIVCGKLPLQLIFSQFNTPPLYLYIKVQSLQQQKRLRLLQWRRRKCTKQKKVAI